MMDDDALYDLQLQIEEKRLQNAALKAKLEQIRRFRRNTHALLTQTDQFPIARPQDQERSRDQALWAARSEIQSQSTIQSHLEQSKQRNALMGCFQISFRGPFATINGLRLGALQQQQQHQQAMTAVANDERTAAENTLKAPETTIIRVPWEEINAALGYVALLMSTLEKMPGMHYRHEIVPHGSTSKMGIRRGSENVSYYNLYSDDSFSFFGKRNFHTALECLVECVIDAADAIQQRDRTITLPHAIERKPRAEYMIGGVSILYGQDRAEWTRAMKYLLSDIKHLMTFRLFAVYLSALPTMEREN